MYDTQWPRFEVFQQEKPGKPHHNVGSVHAPDAEMALQNGRDVFARRPDCHSLWVVPAMAILMKTAEELAADDTWQMQGDVLTETAEPYAVFQKRGQRRAMTYVTYVGEVMARSAVQALQQALTTFGQGAPLVWWVCPARAITRSRPDEVDSLFASAEDKLYRLPNQYRTVFAMSKIRQAEGVEGVDDDE
jgi:ring-1,2-phenylacetyl-CoA epoxidase subunit PaaB